MSRILPRILLAIYSLCLLALYLAMCSLAIGFEIKVGRVDISSALLNEVADQWQQQPFVDAIVVNRTSFGQSQTEYACPDNYPEHVMGRFYYGADVACDCLGIYSEDITGDN